jgi:hypothetical protein
VKGGESEAWDLERYSIELSYAVARLDELGLEDGCKVESIRGVIAHFPSQMRLSAFALLQTVQSRTTLRRYAIDA